MREAVLRYNETMQEMIGQTLLERYTIESEVGKGGMGVVYKARDNLLDRTVAIKFINTGGIGTTGKARLLQEARAAAQLNHPNIVSIYDVAEMGDEAFLVMEFVEGSTLRQSDRPNLTAALIALRQICSALDHAHERGVIHRDLKPENIIVSNSGAHKLMDFGLARSANAAHLTEEGMIVGTMSYLAPELIQGAEAGVQSDLYAFGIILYELLTGSPPFAGDVNTIIAQHLHASVKSPSESNPIVPAWLDTLALQLLSKHPADRPVSARAVLESLETSASTKQTSGYSLSLARRDNLPIEITSFIGRKKEIVEISESLVASRLLTLTGPGGTGKTRLSLQVAARLLDIFDDGVWFIDLAPISNPDLVPNAIANVMGVREEPNRPLMDTLLDCMKGRNTLLILDNCEHLIETCARLSESILQTDPHPRILASSREPLGIAGEKVYRVPPLDVPAHAETLTVEESGQYASIRLFIERALQTQSTFKVTNTNAPVIAKICRRLDGIPLAIELAAARVKSLGVEQIASHLDDSFRLLTGGSRTALPRQQTLHAAIGWSYDLLREEEQQLFARLSVFAGNWMLEAAEQVCIRDQGDLDILNLLVQLVDKSLVIMDETQEEVRYRLLDTTRQFAREKLIECGDEAVFRDRHLDYFIRLAKEAEPQLRGSSQLIWLDRLETNLNNLRAALEWTQQSGRFEDGLRLSTSLWWFWNLRSLPGEGFEWLARGLKQSQEKNFPPALRAKSLHRAAHLGHYLGEPFAQRKAWLEESLASNRSLSDIESCAHTLIFLAWMEPDNYKALALYKEALELAHRIGAWQVAATNLNLADLVADMGEIDKAIALLEETTSTFREIGDRWGVAFSLVSLAYAKSINKKHEEAGKHLSECLALFGELKHRPGIRIATFIRGELARGQEDYKRALRYYEETLSIAHEMGLRSAIAMGSLHLGIVHRHLSDYPRAAALTLEAIAIYQAQGSTRLMPDCLAGLAKIYAASGKTKQSAQLFGAAEAYDDADPDTIEPMEYVQIRQSAREQLGESAFDQLFEEGQAMSIEQAIALAERVQE